MRQYNYHPEKYHIGGDPIHEEFAVIGASETSMVKALSLSAALMSEAVNEDDAADWGLVFERECNHNDYAQSVLNGDYGEDIYIIRREYNTAIWKE